VTIELAERTEKIRQVKTFILNFLWQKRKNPNIIAGDFHEHFVRRNKTRDPLVRLMNSKDIVREGYDKVSYAYRNDTGHAAFSPDYARQLAALIPLLPTDSKVLELGCGCGVPVAQILSENFAVTGVDISPVQIERARSAAPQADFICADMTEINFPAKSFAAIVSFYAIIHLPLEEQPALFAKLFEWLQPEGYLLVTVGSRAWTGTETDWLDVSGATMFWSHADAETYESWLSEFGFKLHSSEFMAEANGGHQLILAQKPKDTEA
jgi:SAM-dependent methyltransferase